MYCATARDHELPSVHHSFPTTTRDKALSGPPLPLSWWRSLCNDQLTDIVLPMKQLMLLTWQAILSHAEQLPQRLRTELVFEQLKPYASRLLDSDPELAGKAHACRRKVS